MAEAVWMVVAEEEGWRRRWDRASNKPRVAMRESRFEMERLRRVAIAFSWADWVGE